MKILVLGGTKFVGRHLVEAAMNAGHDLTLFNRGKQAPELFGDITNLTNLIGDRSSDLRALCSGEWDVVFDLSGYRPAEVRASAELLLPRASRYIFVSSISAYDFASIDQARDLASPDLAPGGEIDTSSVRKFRGITESDSVFQTVVDDGYGHLKAACEKAVQEIYGDDAVIIRPGLIVGPYDPTFRFNYWLDRMRRGGYVLAPGRPERFVQIIDARDLVLFMLKVLDKPKAPDSESLSESNSVSNALSGQAEIYNATGPLRKMTMEHVLNAIADHVPPDSPPCRFVWASDAQLSAHSIEEWTELPLWLKEDGDSRSFYNIDSGKAEGEGLICRPLGQTVQDIFRLDTGFARGRGQSQVLPTMGESLEAAVLEALLS